MWPKMLLEFLPHLSRLIPAADRYLNSRSDSDKAQEAALVSLGDEFRGGIAKIADEQAGLRRDLQAHVANSAQMGVDAARARIGVESLESRLILVEKRLTGMIRLLWAAAVLLAFSLILSAVRLWR